MSHVAQRHYAEHFRSVARRAASPRPEDHDLPVLAAGEELPRAPGWPALMAKGIQPAVFLGAERRLSGNR